MNKTKTGLITAGIIIVGLLVACVRANADMVVETPGAKALFQIDGKQVTPLEAQASAIKGSGIVTRCTVIKGAITGDGKPAYRCKAVQLVGNPLTGTTHWKSL